MTAWDLLGLCRRYWALTLLGVMLTGAALFYAFQAKGTYNGQVDMVLLAPQSQTRNAFVDSPGSLVMLAGVVAKVTGGPEGAARLVSDDVTLAGEGVKSGYSVDQPNSGGQWEYRFSTPVLHLQSAGVTEQAARDSLQQAVSAVQTALSDLQERASVDKRFFVGIQLSPAQPIFVYSHGSKSRAVGGILFVGLLATFAAVLAADQHVRRRMQRDPLNKVSFVDDEFIDDEPGVTQLAGST